MSGLPAFFQSHGGVIAAILVVLVIFNTIMAAFAKIFEALGKQEPEWMQKAGAIGLKITQWLSANTPTPPPATPPPGAPKV